MFLEKYETYHAFVFAPLGKTSGKFFYSDLELINNEVPFMSKLRYTCA